MQPIHYAEKITLLADAKVCGLPTTVTMVGVGYQRTLSLETTTSKATFRSLRSNGWPVKEAVVDPIIGMVIRVPEGFVDSKRKGHSEDSTSSSVDVPLSFSASARHVRERGSMTTTTTEALTEEFHALVHRDSMVSLPSASLRLEDRFAGKSPTSKTDKMIQAPIKTFDYQYVEGLGEVPFPSLPALPRRSCV